MTAQPHEKQQTEATRNEIADLWETLNFKMTPEQTDANIAAYFAEKRAKAAKREGRE